ncbi:cytochrome p450 monooxygenase [Grosmannia clavigera kw1407]|uniref:Cytochrome p450 monooxygenase n=1 Tax=Grosmannia clavigera (strain kw1407 / UAMH 11150) TaxID=655863 RepID=F0XE33_GROCL|nr:cytochrome p450 monooxygenase [Grosmannia clavigera kw1407]EFX03575.1 cytochrome p450 monooxygenase [Grosmannia clavigera kw1407]
MALIQELMVPGQPNVAVLLLVAVAASALWLALAAARQRSRRKGVPLPPGPKGEPILGHLRVIPTDNPEYAYANWARELKSDVLHFNVLGQDIVVLNSVKSAVDLLDRRGAKYADRPRFVLFEVMGWRKTLTFLRWGEAFRMHRKILQRSFSKTNIQVYRDLQTRETHVAMRGVLHAPADWEQVLRRYATAIVLGIGFGITLKSDKDPYVQMAVDASYALGHGGAPAGTLVDFFPLFKSFPSWLLRDRSLQFARDWRWAIRQIHDAPFAAVAGDMEGGTMAETKTKTKTEKTTPNKDSLIAALLAQRQAQLEAGVLPANTELSVDDIKGAAGAVYAAGQDTTWSTLVVFVLNMVLQPEVQAKAQGLLDAVLVSPDGKTRRLPTFSDRPALRYIDLIVQETLRWCPVSPVGVPHRALEDDVYDGMFIPKGSFVYANARAMTHDERVYQNPDRFEPDRFASVEEGGRGEPLPVGQFGFGRRICVGQHLAEANVWIVVATMLAAFDIGRAKGPDGQDIIPVVKVTNGLTSHPNSFPCTITPRSDTWAQVVETAAQQAL